MNLEIFSKFLVVSTAGGVLVAVPATTFLFGKNSETANLFVESLSKNQHIFKNVSKEDLAKNECKVLLTDVENNKSQIIVCPIGASTTFLYTKENSQELEKVKSFSSSVSSGTYRGGKWENDYKLQFQLAKTRNSRASYSTTIKISEQENLNFNKLKDVSLPTCSLKENKLLCKGNNSQNSNLEISLSSSVSREFLIK